MATRAQIIDAIIAEAVGEGDMGMAAVAWSMRNRAMEEGKPITSVVNGGAYSGLANPGSGVRRAQENPQIRTRVDQILNAVENGDIADPTHGAVHYWSPKGMEAMGKGDPYWADEEESEYGRLTIGGHVYLPKRDPSGPKLSFKDAPTPAPMPAELRTRSATAVDAVTEMAGAADTPAMAYATPFAGATDSVRRGLAVNTAKPAERPKPQFARLPDGSIDYNAVLERINSNKSLSDGPQDRGIPGGLGKRAIDRARASAAPLADLATASRERLLTDPGAVDATVRSGTPGPDLATALAATAAARARREALAARPAVTAQTTRQAADTRTLRDANQANTNAERTRTVVASIPTTAPAAPRTAVTPASSRAAADLRSMREANQAGTDAARSATVVARIPTTPAPARLPELRPSNIGQAPATRTVPSVRVVPRNTNVATARSEQAMVRATAPKPVQAPVAAPVRTSVTAPRVGVPQSYAGQDRSPVRTAVKPLTMAPVSTVAQPAGSINPNKTMDRLAPGVLEPDAAPLGGVNYQTARLAPTPQTRGAAARKLAPVIVTAEAPKTAPTPRVRPMAVGTEIDVQQPLTITRTKPIQNKPAVKKEPNLIEQIGKNLMENTLAGKALGGATVGLGNLAAGRPLLGNTAQQGAALKGIGDTLMENTLAGRIIGMFTGQRQNPLESLAQFLQPKQNSPVGTNLGVAANGGQMIQGVNGIKNSLTQASDAWKRATGQSSYGSGQSNDTRYESYF